MNSRRELLKLSVGATQVGLLSRFGLLGRAHAAGAGGRPTKLFAIWLRGGCHWESVFAPFTRAGIRKYMPAPDGGNKPWGYLDSQVENFDRSSADLDSPGPVRKLRGPIYWNWADPKDPSNTNPASGGKQVYRPYGYIWADPQYKLYEQTAVLVGADQGTAAHGSGVVAGQCGVAGANFRAPALTAVVGNAMNARFSDLRPLPNVSLDGSYPPLAVGLPALANPSLLSGASSIEPTLSDRRDTAWKGLRTRAAAPNAAIDGKALSGTVPLTAVDQALLEATRADRGASSLGTDGYIEQLYDTYKGASKTIARDLVNVLGKTKGFEKLQANPLYSADKFCIGYADICGPASSMADFDFALQLLKSDLVTSVTIGAMSVANGNLDTHQVGGPQVHANLLHILLEQVGRVVAEMSVTPSQSGQGTLLDETLVYIYSDFGRTFPKVGSDHHPATCAILCGGGIIGNQMVGGYDETNNGSPMGMPVAIIEEGQQKTTRPPKSQDIAATVLGAFGLQPGKPVSEGGFFIPGGYGFYDGVIRPG